MFSPFTIPFTLLAALGSTAILFAGLYFLWGWWAGVVVGTGYLIGALGMLALTFLGRYLALAIFGRAGDDEPNADRTGASLRVARPDGSEIHVEMYGPEHGPRVILTHGWGLNSTAWYYIRRELASRFRVVVWDLPGLGMSSAPRTGDFHLEKLASDLEAVIEQTGEGPAVLVGHSIGGMIMLTFAKRFPQQLGRTVAGMALLNTTYENPVRTTTAHRLFETLQKPLLEPVLHVAIWTSPVFHLMSWLSYLNGSSIVISALTGFGGNQTRGQLDFATRLTTQASPGVLARGTLGMFKYDARSILRFVHVPVLLITGHVDRLTVPEASRFLRDTLPHAELIKVRPAGHMTVLEHHERIAAELADFCEWRAEPLEREPGQIQRAA
jgi:pimeloyl-ACP methyl ester carboxylesterase